VSTKTLLLFPLLLIYTIGLIMIFDTSSGEVVDLALGKGFQGSQFSAFFKQLLWGACSCAVAFALFGIGWKRFFECSPWIYLAVSFLLLLVLVPGVGICANGSRRWLGIRGMSIQPSEFLKVALPAYFLYLCSKTPSIYTDIRAFLKFLSKVCAPIVLVILEPNNGTAGVLILLVIVLTIVSGIPKRFWLLPLCVALSSLVLFAVSSGYVQKRIDSYLHPEKDIRGKGHQPYQAKIAAGSGGLLGKGPAKSMQKFSYLPEAQNDYIAAIFAEEYGFIGITTLIGLYLWLFAEVLTITYRTRSPQVFTWSLSIYFLLCLQTFMNLGVVSGLLPSTGLNLPFFSQGGSSLMANSINIALLYSIAQEETAYA